jgi:hypothetical protein
MSIPIEFINLIIRKSTLETKYKGGLAQFIKDIPNQSFREDEELVRYGCMNSSDLERFIDLTLERGLEYKEMDTDDFVIINTYSGLSWEVGWLEHNYVESWSTKKLL